MILRSSPVEASNPGALTLYATPTGDVTWHHASFVRAPPAQRGRFHRGDQNGGA